jgi:hypothetical protein
MAGDSEAMKVLERLKRLEGIVGRFSVYASRFPQYVLLAATHRDADAYIAEFNVKTPLSRSATEIVEERMNAASAALANGDMDAYRQICKETSGKTYRDVVGTSKR